MSEFTPFSFEELQVECTLKKRWVNVIMTRTPLYLSHVCSYTVLSCSVSRISQSIVKVSFPYRF